MFNPLTIALFIGFFGWGCVLVLAILERKARQEARKQKTFAQNYQLQADELAKQFKEYGTTAVRWERPKAHNKADDFYWLVKIDKLDYLFTDEAMNVALDRAISMHERKWL